MGYEPIRYFLLTAGYRMPLNYTVELLNSCKASLGASVHLPRQPDFLIKNAKGESNLLAEKAAAAKVKFNTAMDDDLNTPDALAAVFELVKDINTLVAPTSRAEAWSRPPPPSTS